MRLIVDADSMKPRIREIIARAAGRYGLEAVFVANRSIPLPGEGSTAMVVAEDADEWIVGAVTRESEPARSASGAPRGSDLVITRDVPLAARVVDRGAEVITDHGEHLTAENVGERLSDRSFAMELRSRGEISGSGRGHGAREITAFANELDRTLAARMRGSQPKQRVDNGE